MSISARSSRPPFTTAGRVRRVGVSVALLLCIALTSRASAQAHPSTSPRPMCAAVPNITGSAAAATKDVPRNERHPTGIATVRVPTHGTYLNAVLFRAAGPGPHPMLVLLHGFPGTEQNFDLAHAARRAGWHVVVPRYRGAWGSPGAYAWAHVLEDAAAVVAWARHDSVAREYGVDPRTVAVAGHSLGGFAALMTAAADPTIAGAASLAGFNFGAYTASLADVPDRIERTAALWADAAAYLSGTSGQSLAEEAFARGGAWDLRAAAGALVGPGAERPLLVVAAASDDVVPPTLHHEPLVAELRAAGARQLTARSLDADHSFADVRIELAETLLGWLASMVEEPRADGARPTGTASRERAADTCAPRTGEAERTLDA